MTTNILLMTKVKNALTNVCGNSLEFALRNISINGQKRGCSGFIRNKNNGIVVYISTEVACGCNFGCLVRYAKDFRDFSGCFNNICPYTIENLTNAVVTMLGNPNAYQQALVSARKI